MKASTSDLSELYNINEQGKIQPQHQKGLYLGDGVKLPIQQNFTRLGGQYLPDNLRGGHFGCFGTTGAGKTRFMAHLIYQDILSGGSVVLFDPKGDDSLIATVIQSAAESGRLDELMFISPIYPDASVKIDPLAYYYIPDELIHHIVSGIRSREEFFENIATNITTVIITGLIAKFLAKGEKPLINLSDVKERITYKAMLDFVESLKMLRNNPDIKVRNMIDDALTAVFHITQYPQDFFSKVSSSLGTVLAQLTSSTTGQIIGKTYKNAFIKRLEEGERVILICNTGSLLARKTASVIARILMSMIQSTLGRVLASGRVFDPPLSIYMDEGHNILYNGIEEMFSKGRAANVYLHFFTQSMSSMNEVVGENTTQSIMDNINTWVFMHENDERTARFIEDSSPLVTVWRKVVNTGGGNMSVSSREETERVILKERVLRLKKRYFYLRREGDYYKCMVPNVPDPYVKLIFPEVSHKAEVPHQAESEGEHVEAV